MSSLCEIQVRASNEAALRLYAAFGFDSVGRRKRYAVPTGVPRSLEKPTPLGSPQVPRHRATVESTGGVFLMSEVPLYTALE